MKIKEMHATFGALERRTLAPGPGLTIIQAPNEGGKSTWCAFLRAMLYGIPTRERDKQGVQAEKNRYQPWSGAAMEGQLRLTWQGKEIILRRGPRGTVPFGSFQAVDGATGMPLSYLTGSGEELLGVSRAVYERSAFIGQGRTAVDAAPELEARIAALVSTGEEEISYSQVQRQLKAWQNRRKYRQNGLIPQLEEEGRQRSAALVSQQAASRMAQERGETAAALEEERDLLAQESNVYRRREQAQRRQVYEDAQQELEQAVQDWKRLDRELNREGRTPVRETLRSLQDELAAVRNLTQEGKNAESVRAACAETARQANHIVDQEPYFTGMSPEEARYVAQRDADVCLAEEEGGGLALPILSLGLAAACAAVGVVVTPWGYVPAAVLALAGIWLLVRRSSKRSRQQQEQEEILQHYRADQPEDILRLAEEYAQRWEQANEADQALERAEGKVLHLRRERDSRWVSLLGTVRAFAPGAKDPVTVSAALSRALYLREKRGEAGTRLESARKLVNGLPVPEDLPPADEKITPRYEADETARRLGEAERKLAQVRREESEARGQLAALGDPAECEARLEEISEELDRRQTEYEAITLALEALEEADRELQSRFSPALNRRAGALLRQLTGGAYESVSVARDFSAQVRAEGEILPRMASALSQGTVDQMYLAVRLAVCELALPAGDPIPLVLDDALANFDDERARLALDCLAELARERQILLFTCHSREADYLADRPEVTILRLDDGERR